MEKYSSFHYADRYLNEQKEELPRGKLLHYRFSLVQQVKKWTRYMYYAWFLKVNVISYFYQERSSIHFHAQ
ncbi:hypothetical protein QFZ77_002983 [Paenibacillus sp. V4I3]|nr:hypothetical protein [Paenibacillus sp. V4I3]